MPNPAELGQQAGAPRNGDRKRPNKAELLLLRSAALGAALLPEVTGRLKQAAADQDRQRLAALRYRLVAADSLPLRWPAALEERRDLMRYIMSVESLSPPTSSASGPMPIRRPLRMLSSTNRRMPCHDAEACRETYRQTYRETYRENYPETWPVGYGAGSHTAASIGCSSAQAAI